MINKITFISFHNWDTKRHGGFHALAEYACKQGMETVFFSFSRPYYIKWMHTERLNKKVYRDLTIGKSYKVGNKQILNITWPTLALPPFLFRFFPGRIRRWLMSHSFTPFKKVASTWLKDTDCFVIESNESVLLLDKIKKHFPQSLIIYRPSDPIIEHKSYYALDEIRILKKADIVFPVNEIGVSLYKKRILNFDDICNYFILDNGVYLTDYKKSYPVPELLKDKKTALFIGANPHIEWPLLFEAAKKLSDILFIIINPRRPKNQILEKLKEYDNLIYIPGIEREEVPAWITNCSVSIDPLMTGYYKRRPVIQATAKTYKAIAAKKPFITYSCSPNLSKYGIRTTYDYTSFINAIKEEINIPVKKYDIDLSEKDWETICKQFFNKINSHVKSCEK